MVFIRRKQFCPILGLVFGTGLRPVCSGRKQVEGLMRLDSQLTKSLALRTIALLASVTFVQLASGQQVTFFPYVQLGDNGPLGATDQVVIAWQTNATTPAGSYQVNFGTTNSFGATVTPSARVVDNYVAADPTLPVSPF